MPDREYFRHIFRPFCIIIIIVQQREELMETIYLDVLVVLNIYVNFFLIRAAAWFTHSPMKKGRCAAASVYGSLYSLLILAPQLGTLINIIIKLIAALTVVLMAFGYHSIRRFIINSAAFFSANFILAGTVYAVYSWAAPELMHFNNACFYIDFSLLILIATTSAMYFVLWLVRMLADKAPHGSDCYRVIVRYRDKVVAMSGLADTGNALVDFFTGSPVIICSGENFGIDSAERDKLPKGFRLVPCSTISSSGLLPVFRPDEVVIVSDSSGEKKPVDAMIGLGKSGGKAIFNPKLLKI